jgi:uncharacterized protein YcbK (DUF882 family)
MPVTYRDACRMRQAPEPGRTRGATLVLRKRGFLAGLAAALLGMSAGAPQVAAEFGSTRTISLYHIHTQENLTITYKKDGKYIPEAMKKLDWFLRDWRENESTEMDPKTIDLLWEMHTELGSKQPINIICGYRSPKTNNMLRRTVGGQAKHSLHMTGQAIDATFPDIPLKEMRYSALIRERGGVGYYPTSGIPFVHVDSGPVRAWPRLPRYELALLFPNGETKHRPESGGPITPEDVRIAQARHKELATQVAAYFDIRNRPHTPFAVAEATPLQAPAPQPARRAEAQLAALTPQLTGTPRLVREGAPSTPPPSEAERRRLNALVTLASLSPPAPSFAQPAPERDKLSRIIAAAVGAKLQSPPAAEANLAALAPQAPAAARTDATVSSTSDEWVAAPEFDDDHPEELSYRPFPIAPLLTQSASADDSALVKLSRPDIVRTLDLLDDAPVVLPMRLRPGRQVAEVMWAQQFRGDAVDISLQTEPGRSERATSGLTSRTVRTTER